ncbi:MAG: TonB-dependent receptor [Pseudomonadota bacterium]|nr:TonB-dependent receptor [Pseudomonadota bacterium]
MANILKSVVKSFAVLGVALAVPMPVVLAAETISDSLAEIVVTAQRREENLQKTSLALQVVSSKQLEDAGVTRVRDLTTVVPGLEIGQGGASTQIYIRGVGDFGSTPITNPAVAFNVDGIYIARSQAVEGNLFDVARVEVLKGPQGTLYGRNASGGAINVITNRPKLNSFDGYGELEVGNFGEVHTEGAINLPLSDQVALRGSFQVVSRRGYLTQNGDDDHHQSGRLQALWKNDVVSALLVGDYTHTGGAGASYVPLGPASSAAGSRWTSISDPSIAPYYYAATAAQGDCIPSAFFPGFVNPGKCPAPFTSLFTFPQGRSQQDNKFARIHAEITADLGWSTLTLLPSYQSAIMHYDAFPAGLHYQVPSEDSKAKSIEARLGNSSDRLKWVGGLYYFDERQTSTEIVSGGLLQNNRPVTDQSTRSAAAFGEVTFSVSEATRLIAGARYTDDKKSIDGSITALPPSVAFLPANAAGAACFAGLPNPCVLETYGGDTSFTKFTWKAGIEQDLTPQSMLFATLSTGFKAGGFDQSAGFTPGGHEALSFNPENLRALELGSRNRFLDNRLQINAEGFYWKYKDHQEPRLNNDGLGVLSFDYQNAGNATLYGADLDVIGKTSEADTLHATVEYLHSRYDSFTYDVPFNPAGAPFMKGAGNGFTSFDPRSPLSATTACAVSPITTGSFAGGEHVDCSGFALTHAPKWSGSVGYEHRFGLVGGYSLIGAVDAQFASKRYLSIDFLPSENAPAYIAEDAYLTLDAAGDKWSVELFGRNLSNKAIYTGAFGGVVAGFVAANVGAPRTYGARLRINF